MGEIINLNQVRKAREKAKKQADAAENRVRFGRTKNDRRRTADEAQKQARDLDGKKRDPEPEPE